MATIHFYMGAFKKFFIPFLRPTNKQFNGELRMEPKLQQGRGNNPLNGND